MPEWSLRDPDDMDSSLEPVSRVSRNAPCPCGSGRKYKKCCLAKEAKRDLESIDHDLKVKLVRPEHFDDPELDAWKKADRSLGDKLVQAAMRIYPSGEGMLERYWGREIADRLEELPWKDGPLNEFFDWLALCYKPQAGVPTIAEALEKSVGILTEKERRILSGMTACVRSAYQTVRIEKDKGVEVEDVLRGGRAFITDVAMSRTAPMWGISFIWVYPAGPFMFGGGSWHCSRPMDKDYVLSFFKRHLAAYRRKHPGASWDEFLRVKGELFAKLVIGLGAFEPPRLPKLKNMDGEDLVMSEARFEADDVNAALATLGGREGFEVWAEDGKRGADWKSKDIKPGMMGGPTVLGRVRVDGRQLTLECNSRKRLARGKKMLLALPGVRHLGDKFKTVEEAMEERPLGLSPPLSPTPPEFQELARKRMQDYHENEWPDLPIPALGNRTPREMARTARGREKLRDLLRDMAFRSPDHGLAVVDFSRVGKLLGLED